MFVLIFIPSKLPASHNAGLQEHVQHCCSYYVYEKTNRRHLERRDCDYASQACWIGDCALVAQQNTAVPTQQEAVKKQQHMVREGSLNYQHKSNYPYHEWG